MHIAVVQAMKSQQGAFVVSSKMVWKEKSNQHEFQVLLNNSLGEPLILGGQVNHFYPHKGSVWVRNKKDNKAQVVRLCLRGKHRNKRPDDRTVWEGASHLHRWSVTDRDQFATNPDNPPWPPLSWVEGSFEPLTKGSFRAAFESFCAMHGILCDFTEHWTDVPEPVGPGYVVTPRGEEVP